MAETLRVNPDDLRISAARLDAAAADLRSAHDAAHAILSGAVASFSASATTAALAERLAQWETQATAHQQELATHSQNHLHAAASYTETDTDGGDSVSAAGRGIG